jgi:hypothetical protein
MDYNKMNNNTNLNYYPTFDTPSTNTYSHLHPHLYNDNSLNPPSTSTNVTRHHSSRDLSIDNIEKDTTKNNDSTIIPHLNIATHNIQGAFFSKLHNILIQMISTEIDIMFLTEIHLKNRVNQKNTNTNKIDLLSSYQYHTHIYYNYQSR